MTITGSAVFRQKVVTARRLPIAVLVEETAEIARRRLPDYNMYSVDVVGK